MGIELSLAGKYRGKLIELLFCLGARLTNAKELKKVLDDDYVRCIPLQVDLLITIMGINSIVTQCIVQVKRVVPANTDSSWGTSIIMDVYGILDTNLFKGTVKDSYEGPYKRELKCVRIIEYRPLDVLEAPLFINWYWLSSSMKVKLFDV